MEDNARAPKGIGNFTDLLRKLVAVPKNIVEQRIAAKKAARKLRHENK